ncbi:hypothetical protein HOY80DRAFT_1022066 [Tuber brumale]|nr:hypothetical protein HOY80DRAFT_1022066 [Tuber brumale]
MVAKMSTPNTALLPAPGSQVESVVLPGGPGPVTEDLDISMLDMAAENSASRQIPEPDNFSSRPAIPTLREPVRPISFRSLPAIETDSAIEVLATLESPSTINILDVHEPETYQQAQQSCY